MHDEVATTVLSFMVKSVTNKYRDVVALFPVEKLTANKLNTCFLSVIKQLVETKFDVLAILVDNHPINRSFFVNILCEGSLRPYIQNPLLPDRKLFLVFDTTHTMKNIFNNFERKKVFSLPKFNDLQIESICPNFHHCIELFILEENLPLKYAHKLRKNYLAPRSIEKVSVKPSLSIFHESTANALDVYAPKYNNSWTDTSAFIRLVIKLWNILNVKTTHLGKLKRDSSKDVITSHNDWKLCHLTSFCDFLDVWERDGVGLTKETFLALKSSLRALIELTQHMLLIGFNYVRLGSMQSDPLESRLGWYRQLSGSNYYISVKDLLHNERKIRALSLLKFFKISIEEINNKLNTDDCASKEVDEISSAISLNLENWYELSDEEKGITYYIAGYIAHKLSQKMCIGCNENIFGDDNENTSERAFTHEISRGGLKYPSTFLYSLGIK